MPIGPAADSRAKRGAATGVDPERREQDDLLEHPRDEEEPLDADRLADELAAEHRIDVDPRQPEVRRHGGARSSEAHHEPHGHGDGDEASTRRERLRPARFAWRRLGSAARERTSSSCFVAAGGRATAGAAYG